MNILGMRYGTHTCLTGNRKFGFIYMIPIRPGLNMLQEHTPGTLTGYWRSYEAVSVQSFVEALELRALKEADESRPLWEQVKALGLKVTLSQTGFTCRCSLAHHETDCRRSMGLPANARHDCLPRLNEPHVCMCYRVSMYS